MLTLGLSDMAKMPETRRRHENVQYNLRSKSHNHRPPYPVVHRLVQEPASAQTPSRQVGNHWTIPTRTMPEAALAVFTTESQ
jgi:hypothetical protein